MTHTPEVNDFRQRMQHLEASIREIEQHPDAAARAHTQDIVRTLFDLHGAGLERILDRLADAGESGLAMIDDLCDDERFDKLVGDGQKAVRSFGRSALSAIEIPAERVEPLTSAVHRIESELNHHARISRDDSGLTFTVWTHSLGGVTDLDLDLARRIDEAIRTVA